MVFWGRHLAIRWTLICLISYVSAQTIDDITLLHSTLLSGYSKHVRPVVNQSQPVVVNMTFDLVSIRELDEIVGSLSIVGILWMIWEEPRMKWNPFAYNKTLTTKLSMQEVWKPDLLLAHPIESVRSVGFDHYWYPVQYYYNGVAVWAPAEILTTTCKVDVTYYPFDTQNCEISFIPWGSLENEMYLHAAEKEVSRKFFSGNGEWSLENATASTGLIDGKYPVYTLLLEIRRRPTFVIVNVILPILFMGLLNVLVFFLPASSGERVSFAITVLLAIAVFLTLVGDNMPKTSQPMSTICYFLLTNLVLSSLIMVMTIFNLNLYHRDNKIPVPGWLSTFCRIIKCKRLPNRTKVQDITETDGPISEKCKSVVEVEPVKWVLPVYVEDENQITWREVSRVVDKVFGVASITWLLITAASFFAMVITQTVPGT